MPLPPHEKLAWLRLIRTENIGPITFHKLLERYGTAQRALDALPDLAQRGGKISAKPFARDLAEKEMEKIDKAGARLIAKGEDDYPRYLAEIEDAPPLICVMGHPVLLNKPSLGVVGARNASITGRKIAAEFSALVGAAGYIIASGLARGIDTAAHEATLATGTVAVVAGGIDVIYPPENNKLYAAIAERGCIVAESPFGTEPIARHFPRRNRIISGLSQGVLIVEAAAKSGSLITARMAIEQNREVFAVPGSPLDPRSEGANQLIKDGAHVATCAEDILQVLKSLRHDGLRDKKTTAWKGQTDLFDLKPYAPDLALRNRLLENLSPAPVLLDELIRALDSPVQDVMTVLLELEIAGRLERLPGNKVCLI